MAGQRRRPQAWERFTCGGCGKAVQRRLAPPRPARRRCLCCRFLDTVHDARMRASLRRVLDAGSGVVAAPPPEWHSGGRADGRRSR